MAIADPISKTSTLPAALPGVGRALVMAGKISQQTAEEVFRKAKASNRNFINELTQSGAILASDLAYTMSQAFSAPLLDVDALDVERLPKDLLDPKLSADHRILALSKRGGRLIVATADPSDHEAVEKVKFATQMSIEWVIGEYDKLSRLIEAHTKTVSQAMDSIVGGDFEFDEASFAADTAAEDTEAPQTDVDDAPVVKFLHKMLVDAVSMRASDLHFEPYEHHYRVRFRIDGELREIVTPPLAVKDKLASRIKVLSRLDISEKRVPQDGRMKLKMGHDRVIDFRVSTLPTLFGEKIVIRILDPSSAKLGIDALGYEPIEKERLLKAIERPYGMILVTGPTGSGKTVSLYTCLNLLNKPGVNIATAEDPSEINLPGVNQVNVNEKAGLTFAVALRAFLRQDPDIIMVGEIRDLETAEMAIQAALTGHLVFSTLHTNDAPSAITRLMELGVPSYLINATLLGVLAQRLVRTLCKQCKQPDTSAAPEALAEVVKPWKLSGTYQPFKAVGCVDCRMGGFLGRMGLYELLTVSEALKDKITQAPSIDVLRRQAVADGMRPLRLAGALRVAEGLTTLDEVVAGTPPLE